MKELDLNGDGVIDIKEFSRWYFSGMKSYSSNKKSMIIMKNRATDIMQILAKKNIQKLIEKDKSMTRHKVQIKFNEPPEQNYVHAKFHLFGPFTE